MAGSAEPLGLVRRLGLAVLIAAGACGSPSEPPAPSGDELAGIQASSSCITFLKTIQDFEAHKIDIEQAKANLGRSSAGAQEAADQDAHYIPIALDFERLLSKFDEAKSPEDVGNAVRSLTQSCAALAPMPE